MKNALRFILINFILLCAVTLYAQTGHEGHNHTLANTATAAQPHASAAQNEEKLNIKDLIFDHVLDDHSWHFFTVGDFHAAIPLPCIIYDNSGVHFFMSSQFHHGHDTVKLAGADYILDHGVIMRTDGNSFFDISITKNVASLLISCLVLWFILTSVAKKYKNKNVAPTGLQNAIEPIVIFIRDEVAKPMLGARYAKWLPYLLTLFFFIWVNNVLGLLPGGANLTGNIATTMCLALLTFIFTLFSTNSHFWSHMVNPPGIPLAVKFLLAPVELLGVFTKPFALMIRLFANILAGHLIILSLICLIFIFAGLSTWLGWFVAPVSVAFSLFIFCIETLVAFIQAFIFTMLTAMFIGEASPVEEHH